MAISGDFEGISAGFPASLRQAVGQPVASTETVEVRQGADGRAA